MSLTRPLEGDFHLQEPTGGRKGSTRIGTSEVLEGLSPLWWGVGKFLSQKCEGHDTMFTNVVYGHIFKRR